LKLVNKDSGRDWSMDDCRMFFFGRLSVLMNVDDSRGTMVWRGMNVLVNVAVWNIGGLLNGE